MKCTALPVVAVVLILATSAKAVTLIVMGANTTAVAGATVLEVGVQVTAADVAAGGNNPVLLVQNLTFSGWTSGPIQADSTSNAPDIQTAWRLLDILGGGQGGPSFPAAGQAAIALYKDSWWYSSASGTLQGYIDSAGDNGTVTTVPAADGSGVYAQGPGLWVGTTGFTWQPVLNGITGGLSSRSNMGMTALFGPPGQDSLSPSPGGPFTDPNHVLGDMLVANGGTLTVPLAQVVASGDIRVPSQFNGGLGTFIDVGTQIYNVFGGPVGTDPGAFLHVESHSVGPWTLLTAFSDFHGVDYSFYNGAGQILTGINLSGARLTGANFSSADFTSANLSMADLTSANLAHAIFTNADLTGANLNQAVLPTALPTLPVINGAAVALHGTLAVSGQTQVDPGGTLSLDLASTLNTNQLLLGGVLDVVLGGRMPGSQYSQVNVSDSATLGGTLDVALMGGFHPSPGDQFHLFNGALQGSLVAVTLPALLPGLFWNQSNIDTTGTLGVGGVLGDVNSDGIVNGQDISLLAANWLQTGSSVPGDANGDGIVNGQDVALIASNWLQTAASGGGSGTSVPEPSTLVLAVVGGLATLVCPRRRLVAARAPT